MKTRHEQLTRAIASGPAASYQKWLSKEAKGIAQATKNDKVVVVTKKEALAIRKRNWHEYRNRVRELTELQPLYLLPGIELRGHLYHIDHKISLKFAFNEGIPAEECAALDNLQIIPWQENFRKGNACYTSLAARRLGMIAAGTCDSTMPVIWYQEPLMRAAA